MHNYTITIEDILYRRVPKLNPNCWTEINGITVPSSFAFKTKTNEDGLSVNIANLTTPQLTIKDYPNDLIAEFSATIPLKENFNCVHKPSKANLAHAIIEGNTNPIAKKLANAAKLKMI